MCTTCGHTRSWNYSTNCCSCGCRKKCKGEPGIQGRPGIAGINGNNAPTSQKITAFAGGGQSNATVTTANHVLIFAVANDDDSVLTTALTLDNSQTFNNRNGIGKIVDIYPPAGLKFDTLAINTPFQLADGNDLTWYCYTAGIATIV